MPTVGVENGVGDSVSPDGAIDGIDVGSLSLTL